MATDEPHLSTAQLADLSAMADGTLDPARRDQVGTWIASSADLQALYEQERIAVAALHEARDRDRAPAGLRSRLERHRLDRPRSRWTAPRAGLALAASLAAVAAVLAVVLPAGTPAGVSLSQAAMLAARGPAQAPPALSARAPQSQLAESVQDVYFPNWAHRFGWRATGQRRDHVGGRLAVTVYYAKGPQRLAYTIVSGSPLPQPNAPVRILAGLHLRTLPLAGRTIVTWREGGHTCILSTTGTSAAQLERLASWREV